MKTRELQYRSNNAYDTILLVEGGVVVGEWTVGQGDELKNFVNPGNLDDWDAHYPEHTKPSEYGDLMEGDDLEKRIEFNSSLLK